MRHDRPLGFDDLEARKLLTKIHHAAAHANPVPTEVASPLALDGTLVLHNKAAVVNTDEYGDQTTATPVAGVLGGVGMVRGMWDESVDQNGAYLDPDTIQLHNAKGSFVVAFDATTLGQGEQAANGTVFYGASQQLEDGTGAFARSSESGFVQVNTNAKETVDESLTSSSGKPA